MRTEVDLTKLTPYQREVLTALVRPLSKNEVVQLLQIVEATIPSTGVIREATKQAILDRAKAVIGIGVRARRLKTRGPPAEAAQLVHSLAPRDAHSHFRCDEAMSGFLVKS